MIRMVELFSGAGCMGAGFTSAGFSTKLAIDKAPDAIATYNHNLKSVAVVGDVTNIPDRISTDIIIAGSPCQGYSTLGRRDPFDARNNLSLSIYEWAVRASASVVVIENVAQFCDSPQWIQLSSKFKKAGYSATVWKLDACRYGVAQYRRRSFSIFSKIGVPQLPQEHPQHLTVRKALRGLPKTANGKNFHIAPIPTKLALARIKLVPKNGDKRDIMKKAPDLCPPSWERMGDQAVDVWGRMNWDKPSNTVRCSFQSPSKGRYLHPDMDRSISLREGARLQGIPDNWGFFGSNTSIARQIGNGVPIPLAKAVASSIRKLFH